MTSIDMASDNNLTELLQKGFRVGLGATASLIEILQNPEKRDQNLSKLQTDLSQLADELAVKGEETEQEARKIVDSFLAKSGASSGGGSGNSSATETTTVSTTATPAGASSPDMQGELQELTDQIATIRSDLEKLRQQDEDQ